MPGLLRKQFLYNEKGIGGGVYLWETREAAEACFYKSPWGENVRKASGCNEPEIVWFETTVVVDNEKHRIKTADRGLDRTAFLNINMLRRNDRQSNACSWKPAPPYRLDTALSSVLSKIASAQAGGE